MLRLGGDKVMTISNHKTNENNRSDALRMSGEYSGVDSRDVRRTGLRTKFANFEEHEVSALQVAFGKQYIGLSS